MSFFALVSARGYGRLEFYSGKVNSELYKDLLRRNLDQSAKEFELDFYYLLHDPSTPHKSELVSNFLEKEIQGHPVDQILIPGNSPVSEY